MLRTIYIPDNNMLTFPIPDKYIGSELEISVLPLNDISKSFYSNKPREIGILDGKIEIEFSDDFKMTTIEC